MREYGGLECLQLTHNVNVFKTERHHAKKWSILHSAHCTVENVKKIGLIREDVCIFIKERKRNSAVDNHSDNKNGATGSSFTKL